MTWGGRGVGAPLGVRRGLPRPVDLACVDWWRPENPTKTIVEADGVDPDVSAWTLSNVTVAGSKTDPDGGSNAYELTDSNDGGLTVHRALDATTSGVLDKLARYEPWLKKGTLNEARLLLGTDGGAEVAGEVNLDTEVFSDLTGGAVMSIVDRDGDWKRVRIEGTPDAILRAQVYTVSGGSASYQGDGTGTLFIYSPAGSFTQDRVSSITAEGTSGHVATQGTDADRPLLVSDDWNGLPSFRFLTDDWRADALAVALSNADFTISVLLEWLAAAGSYEAVIDLYGSERYHLGRDNSGNVYTFSTDYTDPVLTYTYGSGTGQQVITITRDVAALETALFVDGVKAAADPRATYDYAHTALAIGADTSGASPCPCRIREISAHARVMSDLEVLRESQGMRARGRLLP